MLEEPTWPAEPRPALVERAALGCVLLAAVAVYLTRIDLQDTPYHLATARLAFATGQWPVTNTFSWTYPDYTLYQQYPVYQTLLYAAYLAGGWEGMSILHCVVWVASFLLWMRWGGSWRWACLLGPVWAFALLALQQRAMLRPDMVTIFLLACLLHAIDWYRQGRPWAAAAFVLIQWLLANAHQMFPLGLAVQGLFLAHLVLVRKGEGTRVPIWPAGLALAGSVLVCFLTPLGLEVVRVPLVTADSLASHREQVEEFMPFYRQPYTVGLVLVSAALAVTGLWLGRRRLLAFEVALWLLGAVLMLSAIRGVVFFVLLSVGLFARGLGRWQAGRSSVGQAFQPDTSPERQQRDHPVACAPGLCQAGKPDLPQLGLLRTACVGATVGLSLFIIQGRWVAPIRHLGGVQPGLGRTLGAWPDQAIAFLKENPPLGRMMNLSFYSGNALVWGLYPEQPVFVDPRFETYPRPFLREAIVADRDEAAFARLLARYEPDYLVAEVRIPTLRKQLADLLRQRTWALVYADTNFLIAVHDTSANAGYLAAHRLEPEAIAPPDYLPGEPDLYGQQLVRVAGLFIDLGLPDKAVELVERARTLAQLYPAVRGALAELGADYVHPGR